MFNVSWGELAVASGFGLYLIGRRDLPKAAHVVGTQVGRVVGFLQGARARADRMTQNEELRQLQAELRQGLRELDAVQSELAVTMSMSRSLHQDPPPSPSYEQQPGRLGPGPFIPAAAEPTRDVTPVFAKASNSPPFTTAGHSTWAEASTTATYSSFVASSSTEHQSLAAVAEQEWRKRGMEFRSRAEQQGFHHTNHQQPNTGSAILSNLLQESLIFDQYDRVVRDQDQLLQNKMRQKMQEKHQQLADAEAQAKKV